ncbi:MAG: complex I subunit 1 family protein, partial [Candidatus Odinarchaeota archaeon]
MAVYLPVWQIIVSCFLLPVAAFFFGILFQSLIRKFTARFQGRRGPWYIVPKSLRPVVGSTRIMQPFWDIMKLMYKQTLIPSTAQRKIFISAPFVASISLVIAIWFIPVIGISPFGPFEFSLIVTLYLMLIVPLTIVASGAASSSPWGALGSYREVILTLAYELPFIFGIFSTAMLTGILTPVYGTLPPLPGSPSLTDIVNFQAQHSISVLGYKIPAYFLIVNPFSAIAIIMSLIGKLKIKPMDIPDAEVEVIAGSYTEYTGKLLGFYEIAKILLLFVSLTLFIDMYLGGALVTINYFGVPSFIWSGIVFGVEMIILILIVSIINAA